MFPPLQGFHAHPDFLCTFQPGFLHFKASLNELLPQSYGWRKRGKGNAVGFVAFGPSEGRMGEWVIAKIADDARPVLPRRVYPVALPRAERPVANTQQFSYFRLAEPRIKAFLPQMLSQSFGLL